MAPTIHAMDSHTKSKKRNRDNSYEGIVEKKHKHTDLQELKKSSKNNAHDLRRQQLLTEHGSLEKAILKESAFMMGDDESIAHTLSIITANDNVKVDQSIDGKGRTALMRTAFDGFPLCMSVLLKAGASLCLIDHYNCNALFSAASGRAPDKTMLVLLAAGADPKAPFFDGQTPDRRKKIQQILNGYKKIFVVETLRWLPEQLNVIETTKQNGTQYPLVNIVIDYLKEDAIKSTINGVGKN
jgi:hypothetical protein